MNIHYKLFPFKCQYQGCTQSYQSKCRLEIHNRTHIGLKPYKCIYKGCNKSFNEKGNMKTHIRTHTGEKPYSCKLEKCSRSFTTQGHLKDHIQTHDTSSHIKCGICDKLYSFRHINFHYKKVHKVKYKETPKSIEIDDLKNSHINKSLLIGENFENMKIYRKFTYRLSNKLKQENSCGKNNNKNVIEDNGIIDTQNNRLLKDEFYKKPIINEEVWSNGINDNFIKKESNFDDFYLLESLKKFHELILKDEEVSIEKAYNPFDEIFINIYAKEKEKLKEDNAIKKTNLNKKKNKRMRERSKGIKKKNIIENIISKIETCSYYQNEINETTQQASKSFNNIVKNSKFANIKIKEINTTNEQFSDLSSEKMDYRSRKSVEEKLSNDKDLYFKNISNFLEDFLNFSKNIKYPINKAKLSKILEVYINEIFNNSKYGLFHKDKTIYVKFYSNLKLFLEDLGKKQELLLTNQSFFEIMESFENLEILLFNYLAREHMDILVDKESKIDSLFNIEENMKNIIKSIYGIKIADLKQETKQQIIEKNVKKDIIHIENNDILKKCENYIEDKVNEETKDVELKSKFENNSQKKEESTSDKKPTNIEYCNELDPFKFYKIPIEELEKNVIPQTFNWKISFDEDLNCNFLVTFEEEDKLLLNQSDFNKRKNDQINNFFCFDNYDSNLFNWKKNENFWSNPKNNNHDKSFNIENKKNILNEFEYLINNDYEMNEDEGSLDKIFN